MSDVISVRRRKQVVREFNYFTDSSIHNVNSELICKTRVVSLEIPKLGAVIAKAEPPRAGTLSPAGPHDNNKDQFDFCSKMKK